MISSFRKAMRLLRRREKTIFWLLLPLLIANSLLEMLGVSSIPLFVAAVTSPEELDRIPGLNLADRLRGLDKNMLLLRGAILVGLLFIFKNLFKLFVDYCIQRFARGRHVSVGKRLFAAYHYAPLEDLTARNTAEIIRNVNGEVRSVCAVLSSSLQLITIILAASGVVLLLALSDPQALMLMLGVGFILGGTYSMVLNPRVRKMGVEVLEAKRRLIRGLTQTFQCVRESRVMGFGEVNEKEVNRAIGSVSKTMMWQTIISGLATPFFETMAVIGMLVLVVFLATSGVHQEALVPMITLFAVGLVRLRSYLTTGIGIISQAHYGAASVEEVCSELERLEGKVATLCSPHPHETFQESIEFRGITYSYPDAEFPAVDNVSLRIAKGQTVGFAGTTGSGKTTLVSVILGLLEPQSGEIVVDRESRDHAPRLKTGYVPQFIYLIDGTLKQNISIAVRDGDIDDKAIWTALEKAQLANFVREHPEGLNLPIGENGSKLSGGQRQRLGIARALISSPDLLVLDEGTSALDAETEDALMEAITALHGEITILLIAHRLTTLSECDQIITMSRGKIESVIMNDAIEATG